MYIIENGSRLCYTSGKLDKKYCQIQGWMNLIHIWIMHQKLSFLGGTQYHALRLLPYCGLDIVVFIDMNTYLYTYRRQKFQNILESKLWSCFKQLS